jgi:DNA-binding winged helix-turn-helix (wHTH) protein
MAVRRSGVVWNGVVDTAQKGPVLRFGSFELDTDAEQLTKNGRTIRLQPQPFKLLRLLAGLSGRVVTREEIQAVLWKGDTFVDFEQGVNFAIKQVREALGEDAERPIYIQTVPKRGYRFLAPVEVVVPGGKAAATTRRTDLNLHKALWANIAELRLIEERRQKRRKQMLTAGVPIAVVLLVVVLLIWAL